MQTVDRRIVLYGFLPAALGTVASLSLVNSSYRHCSVSLAQVCKAARKGPGNPSIPKQESLLVVSGCRIEHQNCVLSITPSLALTHTLVLPRTLALSHPRRLSIAAIFIPVAASGSRSQCIG